MCCLSIDRSLNLGLIARKISISINLYELNNLAGTWRLLDLERVDDLKAYRDMIVE